MNATASNDWHELNYSYLTIAAQQVHQLLERHADPNQVQPETATESILAAIAATMPAPPALEQLVTIFKLSSFERDILLLGVAMELIPNFKLLCAKIQGNPELNYPTWGLAQTVFPSFNWGATKLNATLLSWQLIEIKQGATKLESRLQINDRVFYYLLGESCGDAQLLGIVNPLPLESTERDLLPPSHQKLATEIRDTWSGDILPVVQLCGADLVDKRNVAAAASSLMGCGLDTISAVYLPSDPNQLYHLRRCVEREAILNNSIVFLECDEVSLKDPAREQAISLFIEGIGINLIVSSRDRIPQKQRPLFTLDVPKLTKAEQRTIWQDILGSRAEELNGQLETLVSQFNLSMPAIRTTGAIAQGKLNQERSSSPTDANNFATALWNTCRHQARPGLDDLATRIESNVTWNDLILPAAQCKMLREIAVHVKDRANVYENWGFAGNSDRGLGISALFWGTSGSGKTLAAEVLANELKLDLYRIDLSSVVSKYIGETEKNLRRIFDAAETGGAILLFDEADALFGKRSEVKDSRDRYANQEVSYLLQRMEAYQGLAILTTNLKDSLDNAFLRRIRFVVKFSFPDTTERALIWQQIFPKNTPTEALDFRKLARLNVAGGNIRSIALNAAFHAADAKEPVMMKHILQATQSECVKLERTLTGSEVGGWV
ncbi:MAG TPA: ATPase [Cyanobacteria bacterium UBA11369]|nr:ATPase [Cyanobacteria bacterium UBA11371]HBE30771.1 ATPase [Cyanobacteria bacterium UBA11368]HBE49190.1 ATPase [Cyanobacteria bacterium UBA11369]